ncbi:MAG TPA: transporter substrate-binding domain-containing protein [Bacteroidales bacterium]|nr:transporter substrate-binding domain-containing protein [Bacteroidales bacterium]
MFIILLSVISCNRENKRVVSAPIVSRDLADIIAEGRIRAVTNINQTSYFIYKGEPMGFHFELLKKFADHLGIELEIIAKNDIDEAFLMLQEGEVDVVAMGLTINAERKEQMSFTAPIMQTRQVLVQRKPNGWQKMNPYAMTAMLVRNQQDLAGKTIFVQKGSSYAQRLYNLERETGVEIDIIEVPFDAEDLSRQVADGEIEFTVCDENIANIMANLLDNLDITTPVSPAQNLAWGVRKTGSDALLEELNSWIIGYSTTSAYARLEAKYFRGVRSARIASSEYFSTSTGKVSQYDDIIRSYSDTIGWDWRMLAALIFQESRFNASITSPVGAYGLMQVMPSTGRHFGLDVRRSVENNVYAGVRYISWLNTLFNDKVPDPVERVKFILASYNAGQGHVLDAMKLADKNGLDPGKWDDNVSVYLSRKSDPAVYDDPVVKHGSLKQGDAVNKYVHDILERYEHYKNIK